MIGQQDKAGPNIAKPVKAYCETLKLEFLHHLPYSLDSAQSDYYFSLGAHGLASLFHSYQDTSKWIDSWAVPKDEHSHCNGIRILQKKKRKLCHFEQKCFEWFIRNHSSHWTGIFISNRKTLVAHLLPMSLLSNWWKQLDGLLRDIQNWSLMLLNSLYEFSSIKMIDTIPYDANVDFCTQNKFEDCLFGVQRSSIWWNRKPYTLEKRIVLIQSMKIKVPDQQDTLGVTAA